MRYKYNKYFKRSRNKGFSLVDVVVGTALMLIFILGIVGIFRVSAQLIFLNKAKVGALTLANEQLEFARNLTYTEVGVAGSFLDGVLPATETITLNGIDYTRTTFVEYVDNEKDGLASTTDTVPTDYKKLKTKISWEYKEKANEISLLTNIVPNGSEANVGGGTISITVLDAFGVPVPSATITIESASLGTSETRFTSTSGNYRFYGVATSSDYAVIVTKAGYSTAKTYTVDAVNVDPNPGHIAVVDGSTSSVGFPIDIFATLMINTFIPLAEDSYEHLFNDSTGLSLFSTEVSGGELYLTSSSSIYAATGTVYSSDISPTNLTVWEKAEWNDTVVASTSIVYHIHYDNGTSTTALVPDADLPGNSAGFSATTTIDLTGINVSVYPSLRLGAALATEDTSVTPSIQDWKLVYTTGPFPVSIPFTLRGTKTIGKDSGSNNIYKHNYTGLSTDSNGQYSTTTIEWDEYKMVLDVASGGYDIAKVCDDLSSYSVDNEYLGLDISPGDNMTVNVSLETHVSESLLVSVQDNTGSPISGADVRVQNGGYDETKQTGVCGQVFFNEASLPAGVTTVDVNHVSYASSSESITVGSRTQACIILN